MRRMRIPRYDICFDFGVREITARLKEECRKAVLLKAAEVRATAAITLL